MEHKRRTLKEKIESANRVHNNFYDYSKSKDCGFKDHITVICPIHGDFTTTWDNHINGRTGCPKCNKHYIWNNEEWIEEVSRRFNYKYDYSKTNYTKAKDKVIVICHEKDEFGNEHGEFQVRAGNHMAGIGCPKCSKKYKPTTAEWIELAKAKHNNFYSYEKTNYISNKDNVIITCPIHGNFVQQASSHLSGCGCPKCKGEILFSKEEFVEKAKEIHKNEYDYSEFEYKNARTKGVIICKRHGRFEQTPEQHLRGQGCPKCKNSVLENILVKLFDENNINYIFQYKFENTKNSLKSDFYLPKYKLVIECQGEQHFVPISFFSSQKDDESVKMMFNKTRQYDIDKYNTCINTGKNIVYFTIPKMFNNKNIDIKDGFYKDKTMFTNTDELLDYILHLKKYEVNNENLLNFYNDIYNNITKSVILTNNILRIEDFVIIYKQLIPNTKTELNTLKSMYEKKGDKVLVVFEDEYVHNMNIVISKIRHICRKDNGNKIYARKCVVREITKTVAEEFLNKNHIQGFVSSSVYLGCFYENTLVGVMTFRKEHKKGFWELTRFASDNNSICIGIGGKLFSYFTENYENIEIKSFADKRWTFKDDNIYIKLGFECAGFLHPDYRYIDYDKKVRCHKFSFRKQSLINKFKDLNLTMDMTEKEMTNLLGFERIWDCGLIKYVYKMSNNKVNKYVENKSNIK